MVRLTRLMARLGLTCREVTRETPLQRPARGSMLQMERWARQRAHVWAVWGRWGRRSGPRKDWKKLEGQILELIVVG